MLALAALALTATSPALARDDSSLIEPCRYARDPDAQAAWHPMSGSPPAQAATIEGVPAVRLRCPFGGPPIERASWDHPTRLDLSTARGVRFRVYCRDPGPVGQFIVYLQSGGGWYSATFYPESAGWSEVEIAKGDMGTEGQPAGWGSIETIRVSAWRGGTTDTEFALSDIRSTGRLGEDTLVALVRCDSAARERPDEVSSVERYTEAVARALDRAGVSHAILSDIDLDPDLLRRARVVVLPHNPTMPAPAADGLARYLESGGRLISFYGMPDRLRPIARIESAGYVRPQAAGGFAAMRFDGSVIPGAPEVVRQESWNIVEPRPVAGRSRIAAEWLDGDGKPTGHAAAVVSENAIEMSHVLLDDDPEGKARMLLALAVRLAPEVGRQATDERLEKLGRIAGSSGFDEAAAAIEQEGGDLDAVREALRSARVALAAAIQERDAGKPLAALDAAADAERDLLDAYARSQRPAAAEFRALWCHDAYGVRGRSWDEAIRDLKASGFTAVLPNMLWGGVAYYDSKVLPVAPEVAERGDALAACVAACRKYGVEIHVWKVNWNLGRAPREFVERMRREGRLQAGADGTELAWLCPSHPENQRLEIASMVEVARRYDVDGLHFDYIRYPDADHCYCAGCRERFQRSIGATLASWPGDVLPGGPRRADWLDWRRSNITTVVHAVSEQVRAIKPRVQLSAAVFRNWPTDRDAVGQDWKLWCERGDLDFVCPMDYTASTLQFDTWARLQRGWAAPARCYPGIGAFILRPDQVIEQIRSARAQGTGGFTIFNYDERLAREILPLLGAGATRPEVDAPASPRSDAP